jgi:aspartyl-tRNA(Asn)/glutamyl-tRNA(Gln) amidotransferase subunit A
MSQWPPIATIAKKVQAGELSASELVERALKTIDEKKEFSVVLEAIHDRAKTRAKEIDSRIAKGEKIGPLAGVPFIAKDAFLTFGSETTAASNILKGFQAPYQATVVERLEAAGAICVGKANLDAFAHGGSTENSDFMVTKNPHDPSRVAGGSSGGSSAAIVLDMVPFALGTDTGGSTRQPANFSGCVGFKPTYGLMSRSGIVAMASSTDTVGTMARTVEDAAEVIDVIAGKDELDATTIDRDQFAYTDLTDSVKGKKIGVVKEYMDKGLDPEVKAQIEHAIAKLKAAGAEIIDISLPSSPLSLAVYYIVVPAEISSNLSRYDGQRYGFSHPEAKDLDESYNWSRKEGFGKEAKRRIMIGTYVLSSGYYDAYYKKAQQLRTKLIEEFETAFNSVDFLVGPVSPTTAFKIGENANDPLQMYLQDMYTVAASLVGIPAISVPIGSAHDLPVGLQIMAPQKQDRSLLGIAHKTEELVT